MSEPFVPKPVLTLVVGVIGVDPSRFQIPPGKGFSDQLGETFDAVDAACQREAASATNFYRPAGSRYAKQYRVRFLSNFAHGAVRFANENAPRHWEQEAILPLPANAFSGAYGAFDEVEQASFQNFVAEQAGAQQIVLPFEHRKGAFGGANVDLKAARARHSAFLLRQTDLLIAIWEDGLEADETMELVAKALERRIPVIWLTPRADRDPWLLSSPIDLLPGTGYAHALKGPLQDAIAAVVAPPASAPLHPEGSFPARERLMAFLGEPEPQPHLWFVYQWAKNGWGSLLVRPIPKERVEHEWSAFMERAFENGAEGGGGEETLAERLMTKLEPRYYAADAIATYYSHAYRTAYLLAFGLSFGATAAGVLADYLLPQSVAHFLEFLFLAIVIAVVYFGTRGNWFQRWLDARMLAEPLRHLRFLALLGETDLARGLADRLPPGAVWTAWYLRATIREIGLPFGILDGARLRSALLATLEGEVEGQVEYNFANAEALSRLHERLWELGELAFKVSFVVVVILLIPIAYDWAKPWPNLEWPAIAARFIEGGLKPLLQPFALLLPALGATLAGIRYTGDFESFAMRSRLTGEALDDLRSEYMAALHRLEFDVAAETLGRTAAAMTDDLNSWRSIYASKRITLPG